MAQENPKAILVVAAHPDDEVIGAGGTIALLSSMGTRVYIAFMTDGREGRTGEISPEEAIKTRKAEAVDASKIMNITHVDYLGFEDMAIPNSKQALLMLASLIRKYQPEVVFTHHSLDWHVDHVATYSLVRNACKVARSGAFPNVGSRWQVGALYTFDSARVPLSHPTHLIDITKTWDIKLNALNAYYSQVSSDYTLTKITTALGIYRGCLRRSKYAEAFAREYLFPLQEIGY